MHKEKTLRLAEDWDLCKNGVGKICVVEKDTATVQNVANEVRLFTNDAYFAQDSGVPHFAVELGKRESALTLLRAHLRKAALRVAGVVLVSNVNVSALDTTTRKLTGVITIDTKGGEKNVSVDI